MQLLDQSCLAYLELPDCLSVVTGYTTFQISQPQLSNGGELLAVSEDTAFSASVTVKNTGAVAGDEVVFLYKKSDRPVLAFAQQESLAPPTLPSRELIGFGRVTLAAGASTVVHFNSTASKLSTVDDFGTRHVLPGAHELIFSRGHGEELTLGLTVRLAAERSRMIVSTMVGLFDQTAEDLRVAKDEL